VIDDGPRIHRAILDEPHDNLHRLKYADWLEENDQAERAEFIRVQCELAKLELGCPNSIRQASYDRDTYTSLQSRERELLSDHVTVGNWLGELPGLDTMTDVRDYYAPRMAHGGWNGPGGVWIEANFRRGFVSGIRLTLAAFVGGPCERCIRTGREQWAHDENECPSGSCVVCRGTGRTPGLAAELFRLRPIERVTLADREPYPLTPQGNYCWATVYGGASQCRQSYHIPIELKPDAERYQHAVYYATKQQADNVLSSWCVAYGRAAAFPTEARV